MDSLKSWITVSASLALAGCGAASANTTSEEPTPEMAARGEVHYVNYCQPCHGEQGAGNPDVEAPPIGGLPYWYVARQLHNFRNGLRGVHYDDIAGKRMRPMAWALQSDAQVAEVSAYVAGVTDEVGRATGLSSVEVVDSMEFTPKEVELGAAAYAVCSACHGANGRGNEALGAPSLVSMPDWYLYTQLKNFKYGVRGRHPEDTYGATMYPMAVNLVVDDEQDQVRQVVAHISQTLDKSN